MSSFGVGVLTTGWDLAGGHPAFFRVPVSFDSGLLVSWLHNDGDLFGFPSTVPTVIGGFGPMQALTSNVPTIRNQLKTQRDLLFKEFQENPSKTRLAIEIKLIDETIARLTRAFEAKN